MRWDIPVFLQDFLLQNQGGSRNREKFHLAQALFGKIFVWACFSLSKILNKIVKIKRVIPAFRMKLTMNFRFWLECHSRVEMKKPKIIILASVTNMIVLVRKLDIFFSVKRCSVNAEERVKTTITEVKNPGGNESIESKNRPKMMYSYKPKFRLKKNIISASINSQPAKSPE
jgi:hypothetical protein